MTTPKIALIWDFDGPIGQVNSTLPYNFHFEALKREQEAVRWLLDYLGERNIKTCFACTGLSAENGEGPFFIADLIREIALRGHEIASHSWKHEWIPHLTAEQFRRSARRSKSVLEKCLPEGSKVHGFVPPHNRPMSFFQKGMVSFGDRPALPPGPTSGIGGVSRILRSEDYSWYRTVHKTWGTNGKRSINNATVKYKGLLLIPNHATGFDTITRKFVKAMDNSNPTIYISAHPNALNREGNESKQNFMEAMDEWLSQGLEFVTVKDSLSL